jgi:hypothetical protein
MVGRVIWATIRRGDSGKDHGRVVVGCGVVKVRHSEWD